MTERNRRSVERDARHFRVGPSEMNWDGDTLTVSIDERSAPLPVRVRGTVRLRAERFFNWRAPLDSQGLHRWGPLAPFGRIEVDFDAPALHWRGEGYLDSNEGDEPLENRFDEWDWSRATLPDGSSAVIYDVRARDGHETLIAKRFGTDGHIGDFDPGPRSTLPRTAWRIGRSIRSDASGEAPRIVRTLEDTPFYVRSIAESTLNGQRLMAVHETLNGPRLRSPVVRLMLPWRMPRLG